MRGGGRAASNESPVLMIQPLPRYVTNVLTVCSGLQRRSITSLSTLVSKPLHQKRHVSSTLVGYEVIGHQYCTLTC